MADRDSCRPVALPDGEVIRVHGAEPMSEEGSAAMGELVAAARRALAAQEPAPTDGHEEVATDE